MSLVRTRLAWEERLPGFGKVIFANSLPEFAHKLGTTAGGQFDLARHLTVAK